MLLRAALGTHRMGEIISVAKDGKDGSFTGQLFVHVVAQAPLERVELVRSGRLEDGVAIDGKLEAMLDREVAGLVPGEYLYVRAVQRDGGAVWSSPIFIEK